MSQSPVLDKGVLIRRALFVIVLILLSLANVFTLFRGLSTPQGMDQAQIAREIARGNGFTTKVIRPAAYDQATKGGTEQVDFTHFKDTYHAPLNPAVNSVFLRLIGAHEAGAWDMDDKVKVYDLDRLIAAVSTLFFLISIAVTYLLVSRIFDPKIAGVTAIVMLFCQSFWDYSLSGLPQMLMLLLFSSAIYFAYRAVEAQSEGRLPLVPAILAGLFFTLLALTHWMAVWIAIGYIIYAAVAFRPRGIIGIAALAMILLAAAGPMLRAYNVTGSPFGTAFLTLYNGLAFGTEDLVMRTHDLTEAPGMMDGIILKILRTTLLQTTEIIPLLGGIIIAPLFFLSLLHPFKRQPIARFRWLVLLMWVTTAIGLSLYGVSTEKLDPNQLHLLFAPIMCAYGIAFVSILWSRIDGINNMAMLKNAHLVIIVILCALPLVLALPRQFMNGMTARASGGIPQWPPYWAPALNVGLKRLIDDKQIIVSDQPWAVAWYADRASVWLPTTKRGFERIETAAADAQTPFSGILISPVSSQLGPINEIQMNYQDFSSFVIDGGVLKVTQQIRTYDKDLRMEAIAKRYPYPNNLLGVDLLFYSDRVFRPADKTRSSN